MKLLFLILVFWSVLYHLNAFIMPTMRNPYRKPVHISNAISKEAPVDEPVEMMTLTMFMIEATRTNPDHADIESLINSLQVSCKTIANLVSRAGIQNLAGDTHAGERLDLLANRILKNGLRFTGKLGVMTSENDRPVLIEESYNSNYVAVVDPLDGFSNIEAGISTGTIFGIFKENEFCLLDNDEDVNNAEEKCLIQSLQPGSNLVAAGYCM